MRKGSHLWKPIRATTIWDGNSQAEGESKGVRAGLLQARGRAGRTEEGDQLDGVSLRANQDVSKVPNIDYRLRKRTLL
jgi:hypothetical protein